MKKRSQYLLISNQSFFIFQIFKRCTRFSLGHILLLVELWNLSNYHKKNKPWVFLELISFCELTMKFVSRRNWWVSFFFDPARKIKKLNKHISSYQLNSWQRESSDQHVLHSNSWLELETAKLRCSVRMLFIEILQNSQENTFAKISF